MDKKEEFKNFAKSHPELINYVNNSSSSWQKLYEIYDIYGDDEKVWEPYFNSRSTSITDIIKNINVDNMGEHINNAKKLLNVIGEFVNKGGDNITKIGGPVTPRPINKFFGD